MREELAKVLSIAVEALIRRARDAGLDQVPLDEIPYSWLEKQGSGMELRSGTHEELTLETFFNTIAPNRELIPEIEIIKPVTIAFERSQGLMSMFLASPGNLIRHYFGIETNRQLIFDKQAIYRTVDRYIAALTTRPFSLRTTLLVTKFSSNCEFEIAGFRFRQIEPSDYPELGRTSEWARSPVLPNLPYPASGDWIAAIEQEVPNQGAGTPVAMIRRLVASIGLATSGRSKIYIAETCLVDPFLRFGRSFNPTPYVTSRFGPAISVGADEIALTAKIYEQLAVVEAHPKERYLGVALRRLEASATRLSDDDSLVDFVIGLESLLAPDSPNIEVTFRFRLRGATVLGITFGGAKDRLRFLSQLYAARSSAVHGKTVVDLASLAPRAEAALKTIVRWFLDHSDRSRGAKHIMAELDAKMASALSP